MKLGFIGAGFIARFQSVAIGQVRGLEIAGHLDFADTDPAPAASVTV